MIRYLFLILLGFCTFSVQAGELETGAFFLCIYKKATHVEARTVRIHQFPEEDKCAVIYSVQGEDEVLSSGRWMSFCESKLENVIANLEKSLWKCNDMENVKVFYPSSESAKKEQTS